MKNKMGKKWLFFMCPSNNFQKYFEEKNYFILWFLGHPGNIEIFWVCKKIKFFYKNNFDFQALAIKNYNIQQIVIHFNYTQSHNFMQKIWCFSSYFDFLGHPNDQWQKKCGRSSPKMFRSIDRKKNGART